jgi:hypothetical protein
MIANVTGGGRKKSAPLGLRAIPTCKVLRPWIRHSARY